jgi:hypothetical protein
VTEQEGEYVLPDEPKIDDRVGKSHNPLPTRAPQHIGLRHLATEPVQGGIRISWLVFKGPAYQEVKQLEFARVVLGACLSDEKEPPICAAIGMRLVKKPNQPPIRYYVGLDEFQAPTAQELIEGMVVLKDRYLCPTLYVTSSPPLMVESLKRTEGLSFYRERIEWRAKERWPGFVSFDTKCGIYAVDTPDPDTLHRELEFWLSNPPNTIDTIGTIVDEKGVPMSQLLLPYDTNTQLIQAAIRLGNYAPCLALWLAVRGLDRAALYQPEERDDFRHEPNPVSGY